MSDEMIAKAERAVLVKFGFSVTNCFRVGIAAVAPDIAAAAVREFLAPLLDGAEQRREAPATADDPAALLAAQVRRQCAEELRAELDRISERSRPSGGSLMRDLDHASLMARRVAAGQLSVLADRWSGSGRTPEGEGRE